VFERTQEESVTDALTGLPNTRFLFPHLTREIARASRLNSPMAVLLVDLDRLKHINDNFSHPIGDRALRAVAAVLRGAIRPYDVCVRYGGDEFIVLLSDCGPEQAEAKRVELKRAVEALPFSAGEGLPVKLSISAGAAVFPGDGETYDALLQEADSRMYKDKAAGHGRGGA
jgi:diguanylate cyclase (GGDEF)-like protein